MLPQNFSEPECVVIGTLCDESKLTLLDPKNGGGGHMHVDAQVLIASFMRSKIGQMPFEYQYSSLVLPCAMACTLTMSIMRRRKLEGES